MGGQQSKPHLDSTKPLFTSTLFKPNVDNERCDYSEEKQLTFVEYVRSLVACEKKSENVVRITAGRFADLYVTVRPLGSGGEAEVYEVRHTDGHRSACKAIKLDDLERIISSGNATINELNPVSRAAIREIAIMSGLSHQNIVRLEGCLLDGLKLFILIELCKGGSLLENLIEMEIYNEVEVSMIMNQLFLALQYLHSKGIVHGDVKLENVLLSEAGNLNSVKLSDFGMSRLCEPQYSPVNAGTPQYMAPEVLQGEVGACLSPCDVWSAGVCAYVLLVGDFPFKGNSNEEILQSIYNGSHHSHMECLYPGTRAFINRLLCVDISQRLTALEALKEPWVCGRQLSALSPSQFSIRLSQSMNRSLSE